MSTENRPSPQPSPNGRGGEGENLQRSIRPQPGPQEEFLACTADIAIYGGAAFGGKTYALLMEAARFTDRSSFGGVIFRRTRPQITAEGGLWDTAGDIYTQMGAEGMVGPLQYRFSSGAKLTFASLQHEKDKYNWQGAQLPFIGLDEMTHFSEGQFWYLVSRNRDPSGTVRPYIRGTCNPDPDSFVAKLIDWWIDQTTGLAIPERSGVVRWFIRYHDELVWDDSPEALKERYPGSLPKSLTFIRSSYQDNQLGIAADPGYLANLENLPRVERERLKTGNWKIRAAAGDYFKGTDFEIVDHIPDKAVWVRYWDRAATEPSANNPDPDWTAGILIGTTMDGRYCVAHADRFRRRPGGVMERILNRAEADGKDVMVGIETDPGQAGVVDADLYVSLLNGFIVKLVRATGSKEARAAPVASQVEGGKVTLLRGSWNEAFVAELENFPKGRHDDQVDGFSGGFSLLTNATHASLLLLGATGQRRFAERDGGPLSGGHTLTNTGWGTVSGGTDLDGY